MIDNYRGGYAKALLDIRTMFEKDSFWIGIKSVKKARKQAVSFLTMLLANPQMLDYFMQYGSVDFAVSVDGECRPYPDIKRYSQEVP